VLFLIAFEGVQRISIKPTVDGALGPFEAINELVLGFGRVACYPSLKLDQSIVVLKVEGEEGSVTESVDADHVSCVSERFWLRTGALGAGSVKDSATTATGFAPNLTAAGLAPN